MQAPQPGGKRPRAGVDQHLPDPLGLGLGLDLGRRGRDVELDAVGDPSATQHVGRLGEVVEARVDA